MNSTSKHIKKILRYAASIFIAYAAYATFFYLTQRNIIFPTEYARIPPSIADQIPDTSKIWIKTEFETTETWYLPPKNKDNNFPIPLLIVGHGNADIIDRWVGAVEIYREYGMGVLLPEYPGYGRSSGKPSEKSIQKVFLASYDSITARENIDHERIVLLGQSIGGGAVCALAKKRNTSAIILISSFTDITVLASDFLIPDFLVKDKFNNLPVISGFKGPSLFIHGVEDDLIPFAESQKLYSAAKNGKLISLEGGHNLSLNRRSFAENYIIPFLKDNDLIAESE